MSSEVTSSSRGTFLMGLPEQSSSDSSGRLIRNWGRMEILLLRMSSRDSDESSRTTSGTSLNLLWEMSSTEMEAERMGCGTGSPDRLLYDSASSLMHSRWIHSSGRQPMLFLDRSIACSESTQDPKPSSSVRTVESGLRKNPSDSFSTLRCVFSLSELDSSSICAWLRCRLGCDSRCTTAGDSSWLLADASQATAVGLPRDGSTGGEDSTASIDDSVVGIREESEQKGTSEELMRPSRFPEIVLGSKGSINEASRRCSLTEE